jgi:hypothetical protein
VAVKNLKLREHPTNKAKIAKVLPFKSKLEKMDENPNGWIQVREPETNVTGWAHKDYLEAFMLKSPSSSMRLKREPRKGIQETEPPRKDEGTQGNRPPEEVARCQ